MRLLHIADLHIGKRVNGLLMIEEQRHVIEQLLSIVEEDSVDAVLVAGDVFDRPMPSREALETCEALFSSLCGVGVPVFAIPGNHDSPQQLAFCSALLASSGLHIAKAYNGAVDHFDLEVDGQRARIHLLPFLRPTDVRMALPEQAGQIESHDDAVRVAISHSELASEGVNILVAHQFVTGGPSSPKTCDSEVLSVGGADNVDTSNFDDFDYVALGHLHGAQSVSRPEVRYSGSPLMYSFSEVDHEKSATLVIVEDDVISLETRPLRPLHVMREVTASYQELLDGVDDGDPLDYLRVTLTDRSLPDAMAKLRMIYPNILRLDWQVLDTEAGSCGYAAAPAEGIDPFELFAEYYAGQTGESLAEEDRTIIESCIEEALA